MECRCSFYCPCEEKTNEGRKKISLSHVSGELSKRDEVYKEEKIRLTPTEKESVRVGCLFYGAPGKSFVPKP